MQLVAGGAPIVRESAFSPERRPLRPARILGSKMDSDVESLVTQHSIEHGEFAPQRSGRIVVGVHAVAAVLANLS
jgi:hypothetical protein